MSAGKYREKIYRHDHENVASFNDYSLRIVGMSDLGLIAKSDDASKSNEYELRVKKRQFFV